MNDFCVAENKDYLTTKSVLSDNVNAPVYKAIQDFEERICSEYYHRRKAFVVCRLCLD